jgi:hypothetical protein
MLRDERESLKKGKGREFLVNHVLATQKTFNENDLTRSKFKKFV